MENSSLLHHHLAFLSLHRGRLESLPGLHLIHSEKPDFNLAFPLLPEGLQQVPPGFTIYRPDWSKASPPGAAWQAAGSLTYMVLAGNPEQWKCNDQIEIRQAGNRQDIGDFSRVQARSFADTEAEYEEWHPWLLEKNLENFHDESQHFYVGYLDGEAVGVCLGLYHQNLLGFYAVATLQEFRRRGISAAIMKKAVEDAQTAGVAGVTLQVFSGSAAEKFYFGLGFEKCFVVQVFKQGND